MPHLHATHKGRERRFPSETLDSPCFPILAANFGLHVDPYAHLPLLRLRQAPEASRVLARSIGNIGSQSLEIIIAVDCKITLSGESSVVTTDCGRSVDSGKVRFLIWL